MDKGSDRQTVRQTAKNLRRKIVTRVVWAIESENEITRYSWEAQDYITAQVDQQIETILVTNLLDSLFFTKEENRITSAMEEDFLNSGALEATKVWDMLGTEECWQRRREELAEEYNKRSPDYLLEALLGWLRRTAEPDFEQEKELSETRLWKCMCEDSGLKETIKSQEEQLNNKWNGGSRRGVLNHILNYLKDEDFRAIRNGEDLKLWNFVMDNRKALQGDKNSQKGVEDPREYLVSMKKKDGRKEVLRKIKRYRIEQMQAEFLSAEDPTESEFWEGLKADWLTIPEEKADEFTRLWKGEFGWLVRDTLLKMLEDHFDNAGWKICSKKAETVFDIVPLNSNGMRLRPSLDRQIPFWNSLVQLEWMNLSAREDESMKASWKDIYAEITADILNKIRDAETEDAFLKADSYKDTKLWEIMNLEGLELRIPLAMERTLDRWWKIECAGRTAAASDGFCRCEEARKETLGVLNRYIIEQAKAEIACAKMQGNEAKRKKKEGDGKTLFETNCWRCIDSPASELRLADGAKDGLLWINPATDKVWKELWRIWRRDKKVEFHAKVYIPKANWSNFVGNKNRVGEKMEGNLLEALHGADPEFDGHGEEKFRNILCRENGVLDKDARKWLNEHRKDVKDEPDIDSAKWKKMIKVDAEDVTVSMDILKKTANWLVTERGYGEKEAKELLENAHCFYGTADDRYEQAYLRMYETLRMYTAPGQQITLELEDVLKIKAELDAEEKEKRKKQKQD